MQFVFPSGSWHPTSRGLNDLSVCSVEHFVDAVKVEEISAWCHCGPEKLSQHGRVCVFTQTYVNTVEFRVFCFTNTFLVHGIIT